MAVGLPLKTTYADGDVYSAGDVNDTNGTINTTAAPYAAGKNCVINGNMAIDQRYSGAATANTISGYVVDRFQVVQSVTGKLIAQQNRGAVTPPAGFAYYLGVTSQSAYSVLAADFYDIRHFVEGYNTAQFAFGTASAKTVTLSFYVYSSLTGTFGGALINSAGNRSYPFSYTISAANTWERKTITIAGDTSGTWLTNNGIGIQIILSLGMGSTYSGTAGAWTGSYKASVTGAVSVVGTSGATFYVTGIQLEQASVATAFQTATGTIQGELAACQRYFEPLANGADATNELLGTLQAYSTTQAFGALKFMVQKRGNPTLTISSGTAFRVRSTTASTLSTTALAAGTTTPREAVLTATVSSGLSAGSATVLEVNSASAYIWAESEL